MPNPHNPTLLSVLLVTLTVDPAFAQDAGAQDQESRWRRIGEFGVAGTDNKVVAKAFEFVNGFIAAGVRDGEDENWCCRMFLTKESMAAAPLRFTFLRNASERGQLKNSPRVFFDYEKEIDFGEMFAPMRPNPLDGENTWDVKRMFMGPVKRPEGGFRLNFGDRSIFGDSPTENPLFTEYHDEKSSVANKRLLARLQQLPIFAYFDVRALLPTREAKTIAGLFGPKGAILGASISEMAKRPVLDIYSGMRPGDGLVGTYLSKTPGHARLIGALQSEPGFVLSAALGDGVARSLLTLLKTAPNDPAMKRALEAARNFLESWNGEVSFVASAKEPPANLEGRVDIDENFMGLWNSFEGTVRFGVEEDSSADIVKDFESLFASDGMKFTGLEIENLDGKVFRVQREKFVSFGAGDRFFAISFASDKARSLALRDGSLQEKSTVALPRKLRMAQGPVQFWVSKGMLRYVGMWYRGIEGLFGSSVDHRATWIRNALENDLLGEDAAGTLSWSRRFGVMLRLLF